MSLKGKGCEGVLDLTVSGWGQMEVISEYSDEFLDSITSGNL